MCNVFLTMEGTTLYVPNGGISKWIAPNVWHPTQIPADVWRVICI